MRNSIDLWTWRLRDDNPAYGASARTVLSAEEAARASRFVHSSDANRFVHGRQCMRKILAQYVQCDPSRVEFVVGPYGKPYLSPVHGSSLQFNLSHSEDLAVLAVADGLEVGVDVEAVRHIEEDVAKHFFSRAERARLESLPLELAARGFFECWTAKEAFVKSCRVGLSLPLDSFDVSFGPDAAPEILRVTDSDDDPKAWSLWRFEPAPGFVGALAARTQGQLVELKFRTSG